MLRHTSLQDTLEEKLQVNWKKEGLQKTSSTGRHLTLTVLRWRRLAFDWSTLCCAVRVHYCGLELQPFAYPQIPFLPTITLSSIRAVHFRHDQSLHAAGSGALPVCGHRCRLVERRYATISRHLIYNSLFSGICCGSFSIADAADLRSDNETEFRLGVLDWPAFSPAVCD
jgi:hypothetical protein